MQRILMTRRFYLLLKVSMTLGLVICLGIDQSLAQTNVVLFPVGDTYVTPDVPSSYSCDEALLGIGDQNQMLTYIKFPISTIPTGVTVNSAKLRFYTYSLSDNVQVAVCAVTSDWNECNITWSSRPDFVSLTS